MMVIAPCESVEESGDQTPEEAIHFELHSTNASHESLPFIQYSTHGQVKTELGGGMSRTERGSVVSVECMEQGERQERVDAHREAWAGAETHTPVPLAAENENSEQPSHRKPLRPKKKDGTSLVPGLVGGRQKELSHPARCVASALSRFARTRRQLLGTSIPN